MHKTKKIIVAILAVVILLAATPAFGQIAGTWAGVGKGSCCPYPGTVIYPWQEWKGFIPDSEDVFYGKWCDVDGNHGEFKGKLVPSPIPEERRFQGEWTWYDPASIVPVVGGKFEMTFYIYSKECKGVWKTHWPSTSAVGTMKGKKVD